MPVIPAMLRKDGFRFVLLPRQKKYPPEANWQTEKNYKYDDPKLLDHLAKSGNYGVICGIGGLVVIEVDTPEVEETIAEAIKHGELPITFTIRSKCGFHRYYLLPESIPSIKFKSKPLLDENGKPVLDENGKPKEEDTGQVQGKDHYVVGPSSQHPDGPFYTVADGADIATITTEQLKVVLYDWLLEERPEPTNMARGKVKVPDIPFQKVIPPEKWALLRRRKNKDGDEIWQGPHPFHDSKNGVNFRVNTTKGLWCCFRAGHETGGNVLWLIAVKHGILGCEECVSGALGDGKLNGNKKANDKFFKVLEIAEKEYGLNPNNTATKTEEPKESRKFNLLWLNTLESMPYEPPKWLVDGLIGDKTINMLGGKRASYKTWVAIHLALSVASGTKFLGVFATEKGPVLYIDEENGIELIRERCQKVKKGMNLDGEQKVAFLSFENFKIQEPYDSEQLKKIIKEHGIKLVIVDSYARIINVKDENEAGAIGKLFTDVFRPITKELGVSWVLLHHLRKGMGGRQPLDAMDELRGSSELSNYADGIMTCERPRMATDTVIFRPLKVRRAKEPAGQKVKIEWGDGSVNLMSLGSAQELLDSIDECAKAIMTWLEENDIPEFHTKDVIEAMKERNFSKSTVSRTLRDDLLPKNKLVKSKRGVYKRPSVDLEGNGSVKGSEGSGHKGTNEVSVGNVKVYSKDPLTLTGFNVGKGQRVSTINSDTTDTTGGGQ